LLDIELEELLCAIQERYWSLERNLARPVVHNCMICFHSNPKPQIMEQLQADRIPKHPFCSWSKLRRVCWNISESEINCVNWWNMLLH